MPNPIVDHSITAKVTLLFDLTLVWRIYGGCPSVACLNKNNKIRMSPNTTVVKMFLISLAVADQRHHQG